MNTFKGRHHSFDISSALNTPINSTIGHRNNDLKNWQVEHSTMRFKEVEVKVKQKKKIHLMLEKPPGLVCRDLLDSQTP